MLFNLGLIALAAPLHVPRRVVWLDWLFLTAATWLAAGFLSRGRPTRAQGAILRVAYGGYFAASILIKG